MQFISKYRENRLFYKILIILMSMSLLMFAVVYYFVYGYLYQIFQQRSVEIQRQILSTASTQIDHSLNEINSAMEQILYNEDVISLMLLPDDADYLKRSAVAKVLENFERTNGMVASAHLVVNSQGAVYSSNGSVYNLSNFVYSSFLQRDGEKSVHLKEEGMRGLTLVTINGQAALFRQFPTPENNGGILIMLDMYELFSPIIQFDPDTVQVVSSDYYPLFPLFEEDERPVIFQPFTLSVTSPITSWSYRFTGPIKAEGFGVGRAIIMTAPLAIVFILMSIFLATNVTYHIYRPISRLFQMVMNSDVSPGSMKGQDELSVVQTAYTNAMQQRNALSEQLASIAPTIREKLYKNLLFGREMDELYIHETLSSANCPFDYDDLYMVMALSATTLQGEDCSEIEINLIYQALENVIPSLMDNLRFDWVVTDNNHFIFIVGFDPEMSVVTVKNMVLGLEKEILNRIKETGFRLFAGLSKPTLGISNLFYCYELAEKDLNYQRYQYFEDNVSAESEWSERFGDQEQQTEIIDLVLDGNRRLADAALENFIRLAKSESTETAALKLRFDRMLDAMTERLVAFRATDQEMEAFESYYALKSPYNEDVLSETFLVTAQTALTTLGIYGQKSKNRYIRQAKEYISQHCSDSDLSLSKVAAYIGINPNYLSRLFYSSGEENFIDTLNLYRIENAKLLLRQTGIPIKEIGFKTGFNSMQSFNRVFKKFAGTTPSQYRKEKERES
ncbi:helix-turn-helix transcriptional regulator [Oscillospiraceae bacterium LTW-04]|nr:AraC family transcriptional regulator [Oscillospiraceae bacterium MB24-C1]